MGSTIMDVAKASGVSASTVSRVLSDHPRISTETRERVLAAVEALGYRPHSAARNLANSSTKTIGLILNAEADQFVRNPFFIGAMSGISQLAQAHDYNVMYAFNPKEKEELETAVRFVSSHAVDGIILFTSRTRDKCIQYLLKQKCPFSVIGRPDNAGNILWVDNDNFQATYQVTDLLLARGHRTIGFIGGPDDLNVSRDRYDGFRRALAVHGLHAAPAHVFCDGGFTEVYGNACMKKMLDNPDPNLPMPTAVVTADDLQAIGALQALRERRRNDVAVVGFNNTELAVYQQPALASIDVNAAQLGYHAARLLINALETSPSTEDHVIVPTNLVERDSLNVPIPAR